MALQERKDSTKLETEVVYTGHGERRCKRSLTVTNDGPDVSLKIDNNMQNMSRLTNGSFKVMNVMYCVYFSRMQAKNYYSFNFPVNFLVKVISHYIKIHYEKSRNFKADIFPGPKE